MNDEQLLEINKILSDVWKMVKRNRDIREDDDYWKDLRNQGAEIFEIHGKSDFAKQIVMDALMEIQRISKEHTRMHEEECRECEKYGGNKK